MPVATIALTDPQRRLLNLLYDHHGTTDLILGTALDLATIDLEQVDPLVRGLLVGCRDRDGAVVAEPLTVLKHADYPHWPGRLPGCPGCAARCHCTPGTEPCVYDGKHRPRTGADEPLSQLRLKLSARGRAWVLGNPLNKLIRTLDGYPRGRFTLADANRIADSDQVRRLVDDGWATLHFVGDLRETKFGGIGEYEFRHGQDFVLLPTRKVRQLLVSGG